MNLEPGSTIKQEGSPIPDYCSLLHNPAEGIWVSEIRNRAEINTSIHRLKEDLRKPNEVTFFWDFDGVATRTRRHIDEAVPLNPQTVSLALGFDIQQELSETQQKQQQIFLNKTSTTHGLPCLHPAIAQLYHDNSAALYTKIRQAQNQEPLSLPEAAEYENDLFLLYRLANTLIKNTGLLPAEMNELAKYLVPREGFIQILETLIQRGVRNEIISAGVQPFIERFLDINGLSSELATYIRITSNNIDPADTAPRISLSNFRTVIDSPELAMASSPERVVTPLNKKFFALLGIANSKSVVVIGDSITDSPMIILNRSGEEQLFSQADLGLFNRPQPSINGLKIGLFHKAIPEITPGTDPTQEDQKILEEFNKFNKYFDIVITSDQGLDFLTNQLIPLLLP